MLEPNGDGMHAGIKDPKGPTLSVKENMCGSTGPRDVGSRQGSCCTVSAGLQMPEQSSSYCGLEGESKGPRKKHFFFFMTQRKSGMNSLDMKFKEVSGLYLEYLGVVSPAI